MVGRGGIGNVTAAHRVTEPDEADGILAAFLAELVTDEYATADSTDVRAATNPVTDRPTRRLLAAAVAGIIGLVIAVALLNARFSTDERQQTHAELVDRVAAGSDAVDDRQANVDALAANIDELRQQILAGDAGNSATAAEIDRLSARAGSKPLSGPGVAITLDDAPEATRGSLNRVLDRDLQDVVNALWRAGATGIAINGQRLTSASAIRAAGDAILVDYQPLTRPYTVSAVGASESAIRAAGIPSLLAELHTDYGLVSDTTAGDVALPAGDVRESRFANATTGPSATTAPNSPPAQE